MTTPKLNLPEILASQAQKHVTHNEALAALDVLVQLNVLDRDLNAPPGSPSEGQTYIVGPAPTGAWTGRANQVAAYVNSAWKYYVPATGWAAWIVDEAAAATWTGSSWDITGVTVGLLNGGIGLLGINWATADTTNRLSINSAGALFNHDGAGHTLTMNKAAVGDTLAVSMQTGFSGRALVGLIGNDNLGIRVSANGSTWFDALVFTGSSGLATFNDRVRGDSGSAGSPTFSFSTDTDVGMYRVGADQLGLSTGGTLRLTVANAAITVATSVTSLSATATNITANLLGLGGATADATNRLSINTPAVLFNNAGTSIQASFNKNAPANDAAFVFQTGFSARALLGLLGNDDFSFKVSPNGSSFFDAMVIDRNSGRITFPEPLILPGQSAQPSPPPAGHLALYGRDRAGVPWLDVQRPSGRTFPLQPHFGVNRIGMWAPSTSTTINVWGMPRTGVGTASTPALATTNLSTSMRRWRMTSAATADAAAQERSAGWVCWRGNAAGLGGWSYVQRFSMVTLQATGTGFFGLHGSTSAIAVTQLLDTLLNCIGLGFQRGVHTNWQLVHNSGSGTVTYVDLGANFPVASTTNVLTLYIMAAPNASKINVRVIEEVSGNSMEHTITTNMPAATQMLSPHNHLSNLATAAAVVYDCTGLYIETDY